MIFVVPTAWRWLFDHLEARQAEEKKDSSKNDSSWSEKMLGQER